MLGPGESLKVDIERLADRAATAVGADNIIAVKIFLPVRSCGHNGCAIGILTHVNNAGVKAYFCVREGFEPLDAHASELVLLRLHYEGIGSLIAQYLVIELDDPGARRLVPELEVASH